MSLRQTKHLAHSFLLSLFSLLLFCSCSLPKETESENTLRILCYDSLVGEQSFSETIQKDFKKICPKCKLEFVPTQDLSGFLGKLRTEKKRKNLNSFDLILGLTETDKSIALKEELIQNPILFAHSPYAVLAHKENLKKKLPQNWEEFATLYPGSLFVQNPSLSNVGMGFLKTLKHHNAFSEKTASHLIKRSFPSWSASYKAFLEDKSAFVWTYHSSEAYHHCDKDTSIVALPLSYPSQEEWLAFVGKKTPKKTAHQLQNFLLSKELQSKIPQANWMFPANKKSPLPDCFKNLSPIQVLKSKAPITAKNIEEWTDEWNLLKWEEGNNKNSY